MNRILLSLCILTVICSCGDQVEKETPAGTDTAATAIDEKDSTAHLPIAALLRDDLRKVEEFAGGLLRKYTAGKKKDSAFIQPPQFNQRAEQFFLKELDTSYFQANFSQTSLMDHSTEMLTFIYVPEDSVSNLRRVVVYVKPAGQTSDNVDRIYMETVSNSGDTLIEKKLNWKMRKYFYVLTIKQPKTGDPITTMEKLIWDPEHFADN